jgi:hypothetical protein
MRTTKPIKGTEDVVLCDVCGAELEVTFQKGCLGCDRDLCWKHAIWEGLGDDGSGNGEGPWCKRCWDLGAGHRKTYRAAETRLDELYEELQKKWEEACEDASLED